MRRKDIIDTPRNYPSQGYENITMADIAEGAELARSTLYLYFKNKKEIYGNIC
jgi:AcrR family transcriptional regulator